MTQVKEMTNQQLNRALTELQGYSVKPASANPKWYRMVNPQGQEFGVAMPSEGLVWNEYSFPYCTDPAASLEVQAAAIAKNYPVYLMHIGSIVGGSGFKRILLASPRERAEAAWMTLRGEQ